MAKKASIKLIKILEQIQANFVKLSFCNGVILIDSPERHRYQIQLCIDK